MLWIVVAICTVGTCRGLFMPGSSHTGPLPPLTDAQSDLAAEFRRHVEVLADDIGERNVYRPEMYARAADHVVAQMRAAGFDGIERQTYVAGGVPSQNLVATLPGGNLASEIVILGAHYDSVRGSPGADDNATGVAAVLAIARRLRSEQPDRTIRFVAFANEEPPFFQTPAMGSHVYAAQCRAQGDQVVAMLSLDGIGYYTWGEDSQEYPFPFNWWFPSTGNFVAFVGNLGSAALVKDSIESFRRHADFPSEGLAIPPVVPGIDFSDHWSFWEHGYPAIEITDTLPFRYRHEHHPTDPTENLDFESMARVVEGLAGVVLDLANDAD